MAILEIEGVTKRFGGIVALRDVTLKLMENEILGLIGPNGSGKTTLVNVISGIYKPESGKIMFSGKDITRLPPHLRCHMGIARTYQITRPFPNLTVLENVLIGVLNGKNYGKVKLKEAEKIAKDILETVGLGASAELPARALNAPGRKKLEVARTLGGDPELMMLDECVSGLTPTEIADILDMIKRIKEKKKLSIIMIEHLMHVVMNISDRVVVLHEGRRIAEGKPEEITNNDKVAEVYFGDRELAFKLLRK